MSDDEEYELAPPAPLVPTLKKYLISEERMKTLWADEEWRKRVEPLLQHVLRRLDSGDFGGSFERGEFAKAIRAVLAEEQP